MSECPCDNDLPIICPLCGARADVPGDVCRLDAPQNAEIARLRGVIYRNCDPFDATPSDAAIINEISKFFAK